jgi:hypothetical protein
MVLASQIFTGVAVAAPADPEAKVDAADTLHTLTVRYLEAARIGEATTSATESIAYYSAASDQSGVYPRLTTQLPLFSRELSALPAAASQAQFAAAAVFRKLAPDADAGPVARTDLADQLSTLTVRQIEDERTAVAMGTATETIAIYRETAGLPGADRTHIIRELSILAGRTREAGLTETADLAEQAAAMLANPNPGG